MWPFKKKKPAEPPPSISFSQVDTTEGFGDNLNLGPDEWIDTVPLNAMVPEPESAGLPAVGSSDEEIYRVAEQLSCARESVPVPGDGVYCPVCHRANISLQRLRTPCERCQRPLLKFGWT